MPNLDNQRGTKVGSIVMWSGLLADIPNGWEICDGTAGKPDLIDNFVRGVPTDSTNPGATGGENTNTVTIAQLPSHGHSVSGGGHTHTFASNTFDRVLNNQDVSASTIVTDFDALAGVSFTNTGNGNPITDNNVPAFFALAYIIRVT